MRFAHIRFSRSVAATGTMFITMCPVLGVRLELISGGRDWEGSMPEQFEFIRICALVYLTSLPVTRTPGDWMTVNS
jgi:hypothetical protein